MWGIFQKKMQPERYFLSNQKPGKPIKLLPLKAQKAFTDTHGYFNRHFYKRHMLWSMLTFQSISCHLPACTPCLSLSGLPPLQWRWDSHLDIKPHPDPRSQAHFSGSPGVRLHLRTFREMDTCNVPVTYSPEPLSTSSKQPSSFCLSLGFPCRSLFREIMG